MHGATPDGFLGLVARRGHFLLESGHHGDVWLDLELLFLHPRRVEEAIAELSELLRAYAVDMVCGPLNEGAFVALLVAARLDVEFSYAERYEQPRSDELFPVEYRIPPALRAEVTGRRVAIVNDVVNAGSAVRGTLADLQACGANVIALASLLTLGDGASRLAGDNHLPLVRLAHHANQVWVPSECPLCSAGIELDRP